MIDKLKKLVLGNTIPDKKKKYAWYSMGSILYAFATLLMTIVVTRTVGEKIGGMFSISLSISQWFSTIAYFEVRTYQITDVREKYRFSDYFSFRLVMCVFAYGVSVIYTMINGYEFYKALIIALLCLYKMLEGVADVFEGEMQKEDRIDVAGKSMFFRTLISLITFCTVLLLFKDIIVALVLINVIAIASIVIFGVIPAKEYTCIKISLECKKAKGLFLECGPLALSTFINTYIINSSKLAVDRVMPDEYQLYYSAVFMPNMVINLFSGIVFKPMQTTMAKYYEKREINKFVKTILSMVMIIVGFTLVCIIGAYIIGIPVLSAIYKTNLYPYKLVLLILLLAGGINAINILLYYILTIMRKQNVMMLLYAIVAGVSIIFIDGITNRWKLMGAAIGYLLLVLLLMILLITYILYISIKTRCNNMKKDID